MLVKIVLIPAYILGNIIRLQEEIIIRLNMNMPTWLCYAVGYVFITSGVLKLILTDSMGFRSHFHELGVPFAESTLFLVALIEIGCGALIAGGMYVKKATIPLLVIMAGAIYFSKLPYLITQGFLVFAFQSRLDIVVIILLLLLFKHVPGKKF
jgi:putative oxidoreductase